jgi:L-ascorbate metabolism protein UlaG (beta-lactamase superfamily)
MTLEFTWFGHATLGLKTGGFNILVDPYFTGNPTVKVKASEVTADYILVTHGHGDHLGDTVEIAKRCDATVISNAEISGWLRQKGIKVHGQHLGGGFQHPFGYLKLTLALHGSGLPDGSYGGNPAGLLLTTNDELKVYMAGDTGLFGDMRLIGEEGIDLAVIPIGDNYTMGPKDALRAVKMLAPRIVVPIHYNTFGLIKQDVIAWADQVKAETQAIPKVLQAGESFTLE